MNQKSDIMKGVKKGLIIAVVAIIAMVVIQPAKACGFEGLVKVAQALRAKEAGLPYDPADLHPEAHHSEAEHQHQAITKVENDTTDDKSAAKEKPAQDEDVKDKSVAAASH
ncbi:hypothetical protein [Thalassotalea sp. PLHSN55]|uniref:hypothetical protein n=1 Tax=Thalassotalea sp. PLHSN55 TaxID=3435888 RepID=UPI003F879C62